MCKKEDKEITIKSHRLSSIRHVSFNSCNEINKALFVSSLVNQIKEEGGGISGLLGSL